MLYLYGMKYLMLAILFFLGMDTSYAQEETDSVEVLTGVMVKAFGYNRKYADVPASISVLGNKALTRYSNSSVLPAMNTLPGVRMEERSPGSYRLNIRGSALRSPFGVRNVKVYYNDIPYTDPGGNSFFNQLGFYNIRSMEIIKGPGSSMYGAGTGGVLLIDSEKAGWIRGADVEFSAGSFNLKNYNVNLRLGDADFHNTINYQDQQSDGYRDHTRMHRKSFTWDAAARIGDKGRLSTHFLYGDLTYQTPGALTLEEYLQNPRASRPAAGPSPSAKEAKAAINTKMFLAGIRYQHNFSESWSNTTTIYGAYTRLENPAIRNFERRTEPHAGGRTVFEYFRSTSSVQWRVHAGAEVQQGYATIRVADNQQGSAAALQTDDEFNNRQLVGFAQLSATLNSGWSLTAGASINQLQVQNNRLFPTPAIELKRNYTNEFAPRLALLKKITPELSVFAGIARGFSPPTNGELLPSTGVINYDLEAESGYNIETGIRGSLLNKRLYIDVSAFRFRMKNTIAQRRDQSGADYFINAGSALQQGIESFIYYDQPYAIGFLSRLQLQVSHTWHHFRYQSFIRGENDFSGRKLPGVAPHVISAGLDLHSRIGWYTSVNWYFSDAIPLNDANSYYAQAFNLLGLRSGYRKKWNDHLLTELFAAIDNLLNKRYSLGNDINAFGNRFYNAAAGINYTVGISVQTSF